MKLNIPFKKSLLNRYNLDILFLSILCIGTLILVLLLTRNEYLYGSTVDWLNQHSVLPDYFRNQFYETGTLLPEFAPHIGGGQNIFHFSYYGLLSPIILFSYLLPNVSMIDYIAVSSIIMLIASGIMCYIFIRKQGISSKAAFAAAFLFQFSSALTYHSHKQIMFVNYMPFLILALLGINRFFKYKRSGLLMVSIFLMIMTSYFYSVGGLLILVIYGVYTYFRTYENHNETPPCHAFIGQHREKTYSKWDYKNFLKIGLQFALRLVIPIAMASLLILPSFIAILNGRSEESQTTDMLTLFLPKINLINLLYSPYGMGLTAITIFALIRLFIRKKKCDLILGILLSFVFIFPIFLYVLNGGLYLRGKVFLPFLPVISLITASLFEELFAVVKTGSFPVKNSNLKSKFTYKRLSMFFILTALLFMLLDGTLIGVAFFLECALILLGIIIGFRKKCSFYVCLPSFIVCIIICLCTNLNDTLTPKKLWEEIDSKDKIELMEFARQKDSSLYRMNNFTNTKETCNRIDSPKAYMTSLYSSTYDADYNTFHSDVMGNANGATNSIACRDSNNLLFQTFMGVKYIITDQIPPAGYHSVAKRGKYSLYQNNSVFPIAYASSSLMGEEEFNSLDEIDRSIALLKNIVVGSAPKSNFMSPIQEEKFTLPFKKTQSGGAYQKTDFAAMQLSLPLPTPLNERLLLLEFYFRKIPKKDIVISSNGIVNRLTGEKDIYPNNNFTFHYVVSESEPTKTLNLDFSEGVYELHNPKMYSLSNSEVFNARSKITPLHASVLESSETILEGSINVLEDGYFTASIPFDKGFRAYVDGKEQNIEKVNTAFIGFPIRKGKHLIQLVYHAPMLAMSIKISVGGLLLFIAAFSIETIASRLRRKNSVSIRNHINLIDG